MVSSSKILTVSYGTFSCTLEGFDDSFDTMKAIAEYFRDLAADDRYFGAEPPTPDAEMLARIAEREISRRVQAHEEQGKIVLKADADAAPAPAAPAPSPVADAHSAPALAAFLADTSRDDAVEPVLPASDDTPAQHEEAQEAAQSPEPEQEDASDPTLPEFEEAAEQAASGDAATDTAPVQADTAEIEPVAEPEAEADADAPAEAVAEQQGDSDSAAAETPEAEPETAEQAETEPTPEPEVEDETNQSQDDVAETPVEEATDAVIAAVEEAPDYPEPLADQLDDATEQTTATAEDVEEDDDDSIAAKLRRIRSVVVQKDLDYDIGEYTEDEHALSPAGDAASELDALLAAAREEEDANTDDLTDDLTEADQPEDAFDMDAFMATSDASDEALSRALQEEAQPVDVSQTDETNPTDAKPGMAAPLVDEDTLAQLLADAMPDTAAEDDVEQGDSTAEAEYDAPEMDASDDLPDAGDMDQAPDPSETANVKPDMQGQALMLGEDIRVAEDTPDGPVRARVLKMKRSDFEDALERGEIEAETDHAETTEHDVPRDNAIAATADDKGDLTPEEEAELQQELAAVEAEMGLHDTAAPDETDAEKTDAPNVESHETAEDTAPAAAPEPEAEAEPTPKIDDDAAETEPQPDTRKPRRGLARLIGGIKRQPDDVERIFHEADSQMGDQENSMRRNAIQHLRAAVAATRAEKRAGGTMDDAVDETPYRSDLAEVVRPRRPSTESHGTTASTSRPNEPRPAPLKLVAEQRVDRERGPVRPRRVATADMLPVSGADVTPGGFSAFAADLGATDLSALLEAAAAYMADVEGMHDFSRPMLMSKLKEAAPEHFTREDGLRSFGQLLREGKLRKLRGGRFAVTDVTEFREAARNAG